MFHMETSQLGMVMSWLSVHMETSQLGMVMSWLSVSHGNKSAWHGNELA